VKPYRILITGSRDWPTPETVWSALNDARAEAPLRDQQLVVVHGACRTGADRHADAWARWHQNRGQNIDIEEHPAPDFGPWPACGPLRNAHMVSLGADICVAFIGPCTSTRCQRPGPHPSHGASHCAHLAEQAGIPVRRFTA
jgi:hypothetical protein